MLRELTILNFNILTTFVINKSEKGLDICGYLIINKNAFFHRRHLYQHNLMLRQWYLGSVSIHFILDLVSKSHWQSQNRVQIRKTDVSNFQVVTLRIGSQTDGFLFVQNVSLVSAFGLMLYERGDYDNKSQFLSAFRNYEKSIKDEPVIECFIRIPNL